MTEWKSIGCWVANVDLKLRINRVAKPSRVSDPNDTVIKIDSDDDPTYTPARKAGDTETTSVQSVKLKQAVSKASKSEKQRQDEKVTEQIDEANKFNVNRILKENHCLRASCVDNGMPCVVIGDTHVKVMHLELAEWSEKITKGYATYWVPHRSLQHKLEERVKKLTDKVNTQKKKKKKKYSSEDNSDSSNDKVARGRKRSRRGLNRGMTSVIDTMVALLVSNQLSNTLNTARAHILPREDAPSSPVRIPERA